MSWGKGCIVKVPDVLQVVVATPGRLWELVRLAEPHLADLSRVCFLVLDEADRMTQQGHFQVQSTLWLS